MGKKTPQKPKPDLVKKPLDKEQSKKDIKKQIQLRLAASKQAIMAEVYSQLLLHKRIVAGVGNEQEFYEELMNGFKKTLSANGIPLTQELRDKIEENDGRLIPKENLPLIRALYKQYGVIPWQDDI
ncbi:MAG: hypothetical protein F6K35_04545 [Okeania sp. SIO2H7]|nr:hypothetical protein [Okeania sp. SIO2H7]